MAAVMGVAAMVGLVAGVSPSVGLAAALGLVYLMLTIQDLAIGVALFVGVIFLESVSGLGELSIAKAAGGLLLFGWLGTVTTRRDGARQLRHDHPLLTAALLALAGWAAMSFAWAELPGAAVGGALRWALNLVLIPIIYTAVREPRHVRWMLGLFVAGTLFSALTGFLNGVDAGEAPGRLEGSGVNANELGLLLVAAIILAAGLGACRDLSASVRAAAFGAAGLGILALLTTASRGALVGLLTAMLVAPFAVGRGRRAVVVVLIALGVAGTSSYVVGVAPAALDRVTSKETTSSGRTDIWTVGWRMAKDNPVTGVGSDNFANSTVRYLLEPGRLTRSELIVDKPKQAHNVYLQVLTELGAVGLALFLAVLAFVLSPLLPAARMFASSGERSLDILSRALFIALCGQFTALTFSTAIYNKQLWLQLAMAVALAGMARDRAAATQANAAAAAPMTPEHPLPTPSR